MTNLFDNKKKREKLHFLLKNKCLELRPGYSEQYALSRDERDIENDFFSFTAFESEYLIDRKIADALRLIFDFFVDWRIYDRHPSFIHELKKLKKSLPNGKENELKFYKEELQKQFQKLREIDNQVDNKKWLNYLLFTDGVDLIYEFEFSYLPSFLQTSDVDKLPQFDLKGFHDILIKNFIKLFPVYRPSLFLRDSAKVNNFLIDSFYESYPGFEVIEMYFKTEKLERIYESEIIAKNIQHLNNLIEDLENQNEKICSEKTMPKKVTYKSFSHPVTAWFCFLVNDSGINEKAHTDTVESYCKQVCEQFNLPYADRVRTGFNTSKSTKNSEKIKKFILPLIDEEYRKKIIDCIEKNLKPKQNQTLYG